MTVDDFLKKYNKCPFCEYYSFQKNCRECKWQWANGQYAKDTDIDKFRPTEEWMHRMSKEVTE